ncbi:MAG: hypothetical protein DRG20_00210 [Deltaproteobacteria bacterium]|nr:hypothetical protein [Deltaproteobacteria bacterium]RLA91836.1 MAG: hypothetical protein DRG20_00210 [Deltaproteobacteria bacterium]
MKKSLLFFVLVTFTVSCLLFVLPFMVSSTYAQSSSVIQSQETNIPGVVFELIQCKQKRGILTIKMRMKNTSSKTANIYWNTPDISIYLIDDLNRKKYFMLKDSTGALIFSGDSYRISPKSSIITWYKFPAPSPEVNEITFVIPGCTPFEDIPIKKYK